MTQEDTTMVAEHGKARLGNRIMSQVSVFQQECMILMARETTSFLAFGVVVKIRHNINTVHSTVLKFEEL